MWPFNRSTASTAVINQDDLPEFLYGTITDEKLGDFTGTDRALAELTGLSIEEVQQAKRPRYVKFETRALTSAQSDPFDGTSESYAASERRAPPVCAGLCIADRSCRCTGHRGPSHMDEHDRLHAAAQLSRLETEAERGQRRAHHEAARQADWRPARDIARDQAAARRYNRRGPLLNAVIEFLGL